MMDWDEDWDSDPDPEEDRYSVWDEQCGDYLSVYDVSFWKRWWRFIAYDWQRQVHGPLVRLRYDIRRHFKRCEYCGKRGCGPYWFSITCSDEHSRAWSDLHIPNSKKLHIRKDEHYTMCREWIWQERKAGNWISGENDDEFCIFCLAKAKGIALYELLSASTTRT